MMAVKRLRRAAVAGYFYPDNPEELRQTLRHLTPRREPPRQAKGVIVPHASWQFSGLVAGETFGHLMIPRRCIVLGPNHAGVGNAWSLMAEGSYQTPLGEVPIDEPIAQALLAACPILVADHLAHHGEHSIEVALPFLQWLGPDDLTMAPIVIGSEVWEECDQVARALASVIRQTQDPILLIASSDFTHYEPHAVTSQKDAHIIEAIQSLDDRRFLECVRAVQASPCGVGPIACLLGAMRQLEAQHAQLIRYATSADAGGDPQSAVGYAGIIVN